MNKYDQIVADLRTEIDKLVEDIREKEVEAVEEARRLRTVTNDYIRQKPFDLDPNALDFHLTIESGWAQPANISIKLSASPNFNPTKGFPNDFPEDIVISEDESEDESEEQSESRPYLPRLNSLPLIPDPRFQAAQLLGPNTPGQYPVCTPSVPPATQYPTRFPPPMFFRPHSRLWNLIPEKKNRYRPYLSYLSINRFVSVLYFISTQNKFFRHMVLLEYRHLVTLRPNWLFVVLANMEA